MTLNFQGIPESVQVLFAHVLQRNKNLYLQPKRNKLKMAILHKFCINIFTTNLDLIIFIDEGTGSSQE